MLRLAATLALAALLLPAPARPWSGPGHRVVGAIAEERMGPAARRLVREIVGAKLLSDHEIATWADDVRDRRTAPWHYVNVPFGAEGYEPRRDCPRAGCAVSALDAAIARLRAGKDAVELADALRWLVHLVADLHQPMHVGELRDRGGNETEVRIGRRRQPVSVHYVWDRLVVDPLLRGSDPLRAGRALSAALGPEEAAAWGADPSPVAWANESHRLARSLYAELRTFPVSRDTILLPGDYAASQRARTSEALAKAGVRLAATLDRIAAEREAR